MLKPQLVKGSQYNGVVSSGDCSLCGTVVLERDLCLRIVECLLVGVEVFLGGLQRNVMLLGEEIDAVKGS